MIEQEKREKREAYPDFSISQKLATFGTSAAVMVGGPLLLHAPLPAEIGGFGLALALAVNSPKIYAQLRSELPAPLVEMIDGMIKRKNERAATGEWSTLDRLLGRHMYGEKVVQPKEAKPGIHTEALPDEREAEKLSEVTTLLSDLDAIFPHYPEDKTLRLGHVVATGQRFDPHFNSIMGKGMIAIAVQGSGKSQLCGRVVEQADKCGVPALVLDHKGEYKTIKELPEANVLIAGSDASVEPADFILNTENALGLVEAMFAKRCRVIVDLPSYGVDNWLARANIVMAVGRALMEHAGLQRQRRQRILPCLVFLDEAQLYLPQDISLLGGVARKNRELIDDLNNAYLALVSNGRSNGYTMFFATQALTYITKWAIKSCQIQIFGRQTEKNALDMCEDIIEPEIATRSELRKLHPGEAVVFGFTDDPMIVQFDKKVSRDESETPEIDRLHPVSTEQLVSLPVPQGQQITLSYADLMALINTQDAVSRDTSSVSKSATQHNMGNAPVNEVETASQASPDKVITNVFPVVQQQPAGETLSVDFENEVPEWKRKQIQAMKDANYADRDIASLVKLTGRKYKLYQQCLVHLGYKAAVEG